MRYELLVDGMVAVHAKRALFTALAGVAGVTHAEVELGTAIVECEPTEGENARVEAALREAVETAGFQVRALRALPKHLRVL